jgi:hypothetical protein
MPTPQQLSTRINIGLGAKDRNPGAFWHFAVPRLREAFALFTAPEPISELHLRGPNKGTKTQSIASFVIECCKRTGQLDGVRLPQWRGPIEATALVLDYPQQLLSVQPAYLKHIGSWPHKPRFEGDILKSLQVKYGDGPNDDSAWSIIHFLSQENRKSGTGVRSDIVAFDEPPVIEILRELRKAAHAGRRGIRIIGETPTKRRQWSPLRDDYGDTPRRCIRRVDRLRAEVRWSLDEVSSNVLSAQEKRDLWDSYRNDPLFGEDGGARWHGDYTNTEGQCPFDVTVLNRMLAACRDPGLMLWRVPMEATEEGQTVSVTKVEVQIFADPKKASTYYLDVDPASGVVGNHLAGIHVSEMGSGDLVARWAGYLAPYSLGVLAASLGRQYNHALIDVETMDHWGVNVFRGIAASQYGNVAHEMRELQPGQLAKEAGFKMNEETKAAGLGCIQEWLAAYGAGAPYADCPSRAVLENILDCELDDRQKIVAGPGVSHGVDVVLWGQKLRRAVRRSVKPAPILERPPRTYDEIALDKIMGRKPADWHQSRIVRPASKPRI